MCGLLSYCIQIIQNITQNQLEAGILLRIIYCRKLQRMLRKQHISNKKSIKFVLLTQRNFQQFNMLITIDTGSVGFPLYFVYCTCIWVVLCFFVGGFRCCCFLWYIFGVFFWGGGQFTIPIESSQYFDELISTLLMLAIQEWPKTGI